MPKFCANLSMLFTELPFMERFAAAKAAGFDAVEVLFPYDCPAQEMRDALVFEDLQFVLMNAPPPNYTGGAPGYAAVPASAERFRRDFARVLRYAGVLKPQHIHIMAEEASGPEARACFIENLQWAAEQAPHISLTIEPLNGGDWPGYFLHSFDLAAEIIDAVGAPNVNLQFDVYHAQEITGDAVAAWQAHGARAVHVQIAQTPERSEPTGGPIDYPAFFAMLDAQRYDGFVSAEYRPEGDTRAGLGWLPRA